MALGCESYKQRIETVRLREDGIRHLSSHRHNPIVADAIFFKKSLTSYIDDFYDLSQTTAEDLKFYIREKNPNKRGRCPVELVEVLNPSLFSERPLKLDKLEYNFVREECEKFNKPLFEALSGGAIRGGFWQTFKNRIAWATENRCNAGGISELMRLYRSAQSVGELIRGHGSILQHLCWSEEMDSKMAALGN